MHETGNEIVDAMQDIRITGNVIPAIWYQRITRENGKPHLLAINLLADIVYWYRPTEIRDEQTGALKGYKKKFAADLLQRSYADISEFFGCSKIEATRAVVTLEQLGVIKRVFRTIVANGVRCNNVLFIELVPEKLIAINSTVDTYQLKSREVSAKKLTGMDGKVETNTKTSTEISQETSQRKNKNITPSGVESEFSSLWDKYPRKEGRQAALKAYTKARKDGVTVEAVEQGIDRYIAHIKMNKTERKYIKQGSTWFNGRCWEDEYTSKPATASGGQWDNLPGCKII